MYLNIFLFYSQSSMTELLNFETASEKFWSIINFLLGFTNHQEEEDGHNLGQQRNIRSLLSCLNIARICILKKLMLLT